MKLAIVGLRGMVGSVLMDRMSAERDFDLVDTTFFSTSNAGGAAPAVPRAERALKRADDIAALSQQDAIITCQGSDYTKEVYPKLRATGWSGYRIDAAKTLCMQDDAVIVPTR
jgi:aspartate-semialdehyde dehydrogenase